MGKSSALNVQVYIGGERESASFNADKSAICKAQNSVKNHDDEGILSLLFDVPYPRTIAPRDRTFIPMRSGGEAPYIQKTAPHGPPLSSGSGDEDTNSPGKTDRSKWSYIFGRIDYTDVFGYAHWKRVCYRIKDADGKLEYCLYGNDEDPNSE